MYTLVYQVQEHCMHLEALCLQDGTEVRLDQQIMHILLRVVSMTQWSLKLLHFKSWTRQQDQEEAQLLADMTQNFSPG